VLEANLEARNPLVATSIIVLCGSLNLWHMFCVYLLNVKLSFAPMFDKQQLWWIRDTK